MKIQTRTILAAAALSIGLLFATGASAALESRLGGQTVYDTDLNVTWLADANYAMTSGYDADGLMAWGEAQSWISFLNAENGGVGHLGYHDWRLPTTLHPDASCQIQGGYHAGGPDGFNCTGSEMGHLFYNELDGAANSSITTTHNANYNLFQNIMGGYWSDTEYAPDANNAYSFLFNLGGQGAVVKWIPLNAMAVRSGQVAAVPVPAAAWLLGSGLLGLAGFTRKRA